MLAFLISVIPGGDVGLAVIILTIIVKLAIFPLSQHSIENQAKMAILTPELTKIKNSGASKEEQARLTFELYKTHKTNPFSGCLVQIPIIIIFISLYYVFYSGINFNQEDLYSFISLPQDMNVFFLGILDISKKSLILAVLAGVSQYLQAIYMPQPVLSSSNTGSFQDSFTKSMSMQTKYVFPFIMAFIAYSSGALALYWITSNIFTTGQQIYAAKKKRNLVLK